MGRPYAREMDELMDTYSHALDSSIEGLKQFVGAAARTPMYAVGSGGSMTACVFASILHEWGAAFMSKSVSPLEFLNSNVARDASILLVSAGGNNKDILSAFDRAVAAEPINLGVLCTSANSRLTRRARAIPSVHICGGPIPAKKDGFLATNSLITMSIWLARAYHDITATNDLPHSLDDLLHTSEARKDSRVPLKKSISALASRPTIVILYDMMGKAAAADLESKLVESGLKNVQLSDYRNFAHGRHNWIGRNPDDTGILALVGPDCKNLAERTIRLIPDDIPIVKISTGLPGSAGMLSLLIESMHVVGMLGEFDGIDPGRPNVAKFGRRIYSLGMSGMRRNENLTDAAIRRKFGAVTGDALRMKHTWLERFLHRITATTFDAVVFDYDGTLCDLPSSPDSPEPETARMLTDLVNGGVPIGIATGRGSSVKKSLRTIIPEEFWRDVLVGYYNCSEIATLDADGAPDVNSPLAPELASLSEYLVERGIVAEDVLEKRPNQISILAGRMDALDLLRNLHVSNPQALDKVKIVGSDRSVDILPVCVSKIAILEQITENPELSNVLCVGDQGMWPGNDFELLSTPFSLSVDKTSGDPDTCWNLAPAGCTGERAVRYYFDLMRLHGSKIQIKFAQT